MLTPQITLFVFGVLCLISPFVAIILGSRDEADVYTWMARQPLHALLMYRAMFVSGNVFMAASFLS